MPTLAYEAMDARRNAVNGTFATARRSDLESALPTNRRKASPAIQLLAYADVRSRRRASSLV